MNPIFPLLEVTAALMFAAASWSAISRGRLPFLTLISAAAFGIVLEQGSQIIFETYEYSPSWSLTVDRAPVAIGLAWALIITGAMRITDALGVPRRYAPFLDATLAISLDLAFDAVAIRLGLWTWRGIAFTDGWFGVPAGNLYTWLFITLSFSLLARLVRVAAQRRPSAEWLQLLVPVPAFFVVLVAITALALFERAFPPPPGGWMEAFGVTLAVFVALAVRGLATRVDRDLARSPSASLLDLRLAFFNRLVIHGFFLSAFFAMGLAAQVPALLLVALAMLALELPLALWTDSSDATARLRGLLGLDRRAIRRGDATPRSADLP